MILNNRLVNTDFRLMLPCLVCEEGIELTKEEELKIKYGGNVQPKICSKCKAAILFVRDNML